MKKTLIAFAVVALAELMQHAHVANAALRWCPRCLYSDPWTTCGR